MKKTILGAVLCSTLIAAPVYAEPAAPQVAAVKAPVSGIDRSNMDLSVRPQDDFYSYVNGGWQKTNIIPPSKSKIGSFYDLRDQADEDVKKIIEQLAKSDKHTFGSDEQKVADIFRSYMDESGVEKAGVQPIEHFFKSIDLIKTKDDLAWFFGKFQSQGIGSPFQFYISIDAKDSSRYSTHIWQGGIGLPDRDYYFNEAERFVSIRHAYLVHIEKMFKLAGLENGATSAAMLLDLETKLAKHHWTRVESRDSEKRYNKIPVDELTNLTSAFNWKAYLKAQGVENQKNLIVNQPSFAKGFGEVFESTSVEDWRTYLKWQALNQYAAYLNKDIVDQNFAFYSTKLNGQKEQKPRWKRGVNVVNANLGEVIGKIYVDRHFKPQAKARMSQLVENLRGAYGESIDNLEWMSADTKKAAKVKLAGFTPKIGYPDRWEDYSKLDIYPTDLVGNIIRSRSLNHQKNLERLGGPIRTWEWGMTPQTVNAYYSPTRNEIVFPAAILQPPFFNMAADDAVNYGGIGAVIGHEMGHGFDDQGSRYDKDGNLRNWWTEADLKAFKVRTAQLVKQYDSYQVFDDLNVNGKLTLGENIGDLSGLTIAYKAYKKSLNGQPAPVIDGLTGDQRFFMGFAQIWRVKMTEKALRNRVATDPHSPGKFRALGSLSNMDDFYKAFDVKPGDAMYIPPEKRVKIW